MTYSLNPRTLAKWLIAEPLPYWLGGGLPLLAIGLAYRLWPGSELAMRWAGFIISVAGVLLVIKGLRDKRIMFGRPPAMARFKEWLKRGKHAFVPAQITHKAVVAVDTMLLNDDVSELLSAGPEVTTERRLQLIEENLKRLNGRIAAIRTELRERLASEHEQHQGAIAQTKEDLAALKARLEDLSVGALDFDTAGVIWVLAGSALATFPTELATLMMRVFA